MDKNNHINTNRASVGTTSANQVKVLNLDDFSSRIEEMNIDKNEFPSEQYYENGFYYAVEKKNKITVCTKGQWDSYCRQVVRAYTRGKNQPVFTKANLIKLAICSALSIMLIFAIISYSNSTVSNNNDTKTICSTSEVQSCI